MFAVKMALSSLPNINLNALILILVTVFFGWKALYTVCVYVLLEGLMFGFGVWWVSYLIVWPLLVVLAMAVRKTASPLLWAVFAGFGVWWVSYLIVWPLLVVLAMAVRKNASPLLWAVFAGLFGLAFGPMMYVIFFTVTGGWEGFLPMWIAGIPYDLVHAVSNFLTVLILFRPLEKVFSRFV